MPLVTDIACGNNHTLFLCVDMSLWGIGNNNCGQLGDEQNVVAISLNFNRFYIYSPVKLKLSNVQRVLAGRDRTCIVTRNRDLWAIGRFDEGHNEYVKMCTWKFNERMLYIDCGGYHCLYALGRKQNASFKLLQKALLKQYTNVIFTFK